jgi:hypothetical protein
VRSAVELYLAAKDCRGIDDQLVTAYQGKAGEMFAEIADLL